MQTSERLYDLMVVGGGAAGYFAAITCAELAVQKSNRPQKILILEKAGKPLGKVRISGGGRCNVTHACYDPARLVEYYPRGGPALRGAFSRFQPRDTVSWFEQRGVALKTEEDGRIFPRTDRSETIVNCLTEAAHHAGIRLQPRARVVSIELLNEKDARFVIRLMAGEKGDTETLNSRNLVLATGGESGGLAMAASLGHRIVPPVPSLFTFTIMDERLEGLAGVSVQQARVRLLAGYPSTSQPREFEQVGPLLITHWGLSGPAVLRLSAWGARWLFDCQYRAGLEINWLGARTREVALKELLVYKQNPSHARQKVWSHDPFLILPQRLWKRLAGAAGIEEQQNWGDLSKASLLGLTEELTLGRYQVKGKGAFKEEFVTCGGVPLDEVNLKTMESKLIPGLYFAGEVLDVDGLTGGFNFQNAWTTGWIAGKAIAESEFRN